MTATKNTTNEKSNAAMRVCLEAISGLTVDENTNHEHLIILVKVMAAATLKQIS